MLAGIEDQKYPLVAQIGDEVGRRIVALNRQPQHGGDRRAHKRGIAQHAKIDEEYGTSEGLDQMMSDRYRDRGLADAADADNADETGGGQLGRELEDVVAAPDHAHQSAGQISVRKAG